MTSACSKIRFATKRAASSSAAARMPSAAAALASLLGGERRAPAAPPAEAGSAGRAAALRPQGQARDLSAHGRRPAADGSVRLQAEDERLVRQGSARIDPQGPAADDHDLRPGPVSRSRRRSSSSPSTARAACGSPSCCRGRPRWSTTCASSAPCTPRPSTTSRPSPTCRPATRSPAGRASARGCRTARLAERESADVRRAGRQADQHRAGPGDLRPALVERLSARRTCRRLVPHRRRSDPVHQQSARRAARRPPPHARRPERSSTR